MCQRPIFFGEAPKPRGAATRVARLSCDVDYCMGHELFLTQFEAGEPISEVPSIIRACLLLSIMVLFIEREVALWSHAFQNG